MISVAFDRPKLEKSLRLYAKDFGDSTAQAVTRWGVQTCRELAFETQVWGKSKSGNKKKQGGIAWAKGAQEGAIVADALNVLIVVQALGPKNKKNLTSPQAVNDWIEVNRTRRRARTAKLPISERRICSELVFKKAMKIRFKNAGIAKGGWLGAGMQIATYQTGGEKIAIGKNYMSWTQKHKSKGSATKPVNGFSPSSLLTNRTRHVSSSHVLNPTRAKHAINWGLKKTVKWYQSALRTRDKKQKV